MQLEVFRTPYVRDGYEVEVYRLINDHGFELLVSNFGCTVLSLLWPKSDGSGKDDILLGYDHIEAWFEDQSFFGSTAGRCCNRIRGARVQIEGTAYPLSANIPPHQLHGGKFGFNKKTWRATPMSTAQKASVTMHYLSKHLEEGYPGNLAATAEISLNNNNEIGIKYSASTDQPTICNLTAHPYFNLDGSENILDHYIYVDATSLTAMDQDLVSTGEIFSTTDTPLSFNPMARIGDHIFSDHPQISLVDGYDHNYILNKQTGRPQAIIKSVINGRSISVYTDQPGIQFYTGNHLNFIGKGSKSYKKYSGLCLETQGFPNAANIESFPTVVLRPGEIYESHTRLVLEDDN